MISSNTKMIQQSFTGQAKNFETESMNFTKQEYLEHMVSCVNPQKTDTVLEVASGTCICGRSLAPFVKHVTCLDLTAAMLAVGKEKAETLFFGNGAGAENGRATGCHGYGSSRRSTAEYRGRN